VGPTLYELRFPDGEGLNVASFEALIRDLNRALEKRRGQP
jgi:hypothetical protein